jgi:luciferase family oxidoreductase group 1
MSHEPLPDLVLEAPPAAGRPPLRLGVLDLCPAAPGETGQAALFDSFELAVGAEALGCSRFWLAEHHGRGTAHGCPELLAGLVAQMTERIRVGTAGVLLSYCSPLKVAKSFRLLQALFPGRIDLGVGAGRVDEETARRLLCGAPEQDYAAKVGDLVGCLRDDTSSVTPRGVGTPEVWVLGSGSPGSARTAARLGTAYSLSLFLANSKDDPAPVHAYRSQFEPSATLTRPRWNVAVAGVCAETEAEARRLAAAHGNRFLVPTVVGDPGQCRNRLLEIAERYETDEVIFLALGVARRQRLRCYQLLAETLGVGAASRAAPDRPGPGLRP